MGKEGESQERRSEARRGFEEERFLEPNSLKQKKKKKKALSLVGSREIFLYLG